ncbi:MAG: isoprenyl transferase [candidate division Zixibacteria bacterium]|nr:isoprenyl transferase [candidate division Zixibacteria bacterium]
MNQDSPSEEVLLARIDRKRLPRHIAIVMDGNGRWAKRRGLPRQVGHRAGVNTVREIVRASGELGLETLTLFAFSTENWKRPQWEVNALMRLLVQTVRSEVKEINRSNVRITVSGRWDELPDATREAIGYAIEQTAGNSGLRLNLALNYGGRRELIEAAQRISRDVLDGKFPPEAIDENLFEKYLQTAGLLDPDLFIRTSGEMRISNFLLYQLAYTEIVVSPVYWPDFSRQHFYEAILDYQLRERRFGLTGDQVRHSS